jgi:excisionase family DNA binding protein
MPIKETLYSVDQVAGLLGLHVRTVRGYVREGRLKAVRIGKQYRIAQADLEAMTGRPAPQPEPVSRQRHVDASAIVEIDAIGPEAAMRLTGPLSAAVTARREDDLPLRVETVYNEVRAHLKIILVGSPRTLAGTLEMIHAVVEANR